MSDKWDGLRAELEKLDLAESGEWTDFWGDHVVLDGAFYPSGLAWVLREMLRGRDDHKEEE